MTSKKMMLILMAIIMVLAIGYEGVLLFGGEKQVKGLQVINNSGEFDPASESKGNFNIVLSNQSVVNEEMKIDVFIDGIKIIGQTCDSEMQHKFYRYYYNFDGEHELKVEAKDGTKLSEKIDVNSGVPSWFLVFYNKGSKNENAKFIISKRDKTFLSN